MGKDSYKRNLLNHFHALGIAGRDMKTKHGWELLTYRTILQRLGHTEVRKLYIQSNLNSSKTDGSFIMANSNSFLISYEILPLAQEIKYLGKFPYFILKLYFVLRVLIEVILMNTLNMLLLFRRWKRFL